MTELTEQDETGIMPASPDASTGVPEADISAGEARPAPRVAASADVAPASTDREVPTEPGEVPAEPGGAPLPSDDAAVEAGAGAESGWGSGAEPVAAGTARTVGAGTAGAADAGGAGGAGEPVPTGDTESGDGPPPPPLRRILESILLVIDEPVTEVDLAQIVERSRAEVAATLAELAASYVAEGRGFELRQVAGGWRLYTAEDCAPYVERFVLDGQHARLTQAALETLAVIAYRQPVSRASIAAIRGVNVDGVVRTLLSRGLVAEAGADGPSGAHLYVTTPYFLERLGLRSVDELPNLAPFLPSSVEDIEREL